MKLREKKRNEIVEGRKEVLEKTKRKNGKLRTRRNARRRRRRNAKNRERGLKLEKMKRQQDDAGRVLADETVRGRRRYVVMRS